MRIKDAAKYLVYLSYGKYSYSLTPLKLQKILYYAQGWSYIWDGRLLFDDEFEAWQYGPVNRKIYDAFKKYIKNEIPEFEGIIPKNATTDELETLEMIWKNYGKMISSELVEMTHREDPWINAYNFDKKISNHAIMQYFQRNY